MKIIFIVVISLFVLLFVANLWGAKKCKKANGHWVSMDGGKHCVDSSFKEIDIYK